MSLHVWLNCSRPSPRHWPPLVVIVLTVGRQHHLAHFVQDWTVLALSVVESIPLISIWFEGFKGEGMLEWDLKRKGKTFWRWESRKICGPGKQRSKMKKGRSAWKLFKVAAIPTQLSKCHRVHQFFEHQPPLLKTVIWVALGGSCARERLKFFRAPTMANIKMSQYICLAILIGNLTPDSWAKKGPFSELLSAGWSLILVWFRLMSR